MGRRSAPACACVIISFVCLHFVWALLPGTAHEAPPPNTARPPRPAKTAAPSARPAAAAAAARAPTTAAPPPSRAVTLSDDASPRTPAPGVPRMPPNASLAGAIAALVEAGLPHAPPPCPAWGRRDRPACGFNASVVAVRPGEPFALLLRDAATPRGGAVLRVELHEPEVSLVMNVTDLGTGAYLCQCGGVHLPRPGDYTVRAWRLQPCSPTLLHFWCEFNYSAPPDARCPTHGQAPQEQWALPAVPCQYTLRVGAGDGAAPRARLPPCAAPERLPGYWRRRPQFLPPRARLAAAPAPRERNSVGLATLVRRADFYPHACALRPVDYRGCLARQFVVVLGDSTLRNMYYALARRVLNATDTGSKPETPALHELSPRWGAAHRWRRRQNRFTRRLKNPVYFAWAANADERAPPLREFFRSFEQWRVHFKHPMPITLLWSMGAHAPGMNISVTYAEVSHYARELSAWVAATGNKVWHLSMKAVQGWGRSAVPGWNNARIAAKNAVAAHVLRAHGIDTIDLFHPTLAYWPDWEFSPDAIHYKDWVDSILLDLVAQFVCRDHRNLSAFESDVQSSYPFDKLYPEAMRQQEVWYAMMAARQDGTTQKP